MSRVEHTSVRLALVLLGLDAIAVSAFAAALPLRLEWSPPAARLVVGPIPEPGALFVFAAPDLPSLVATPTMILQTNTPLAGELQLPVAAADGVSNHAFYKAAHWPGHAPALVDIPAGTFLMGTPPSEAERSPWEGPQTTVTISRSFKMGKFEVTQSEYQTLMGNNPSYYAGYSNQPVEQVSWHNAMDYCARLTASQRAAGCLPEGWAYRLPTEAEWEYACRAGTTTAFAYGSALRSGMANFNGRQEYDATTGTVFNPAGVAVDRPTAVGAYPPNDWQLFDMHGNVFEWCVDRWGYNLPGGNVTDPAGPDSGEDRLVRGGCWYNDARVCRSAYRIRGLPGYRGNEIGFRVVLVPPTP